MNLTGELKKRGVRAGCMAMDDFEFEDLPEAGNVYCIISTAGQGEYPPNSVSFMKALQNPDLPVDFLKDVKFTTFGLGDSSYVYFNKAAKDCDAAFEKLGAARICEAGYGDDKDEEKFETVYNEWAPNMFSDAGLPVPPDVLLPPNYGLNLVENVEEEPYLPPTF